MQRWGGLPVSAWKPPFLVFCLTVSVTADADANRRPYTWSLTLKTPVMSCGSLDGSDETISKHKNASVIIHPCNVHTGWTHEPLSILILDLYAAQGTQSPRVSPCQTNANDRSWVTSPLRAVQTLNLVDYSAPVPAGNSGA